MSELRPSTERWEVEPEPEPAGGFYIVHTPSDVKALVLDRAEGQKIADAMNEAGAERDRLEAALRDCVELMQEDDYGPGTAWDQAIVAARVALGEDGSAE